MFLHIMHNDKFNEPFIEFIERKFNIEEHCFIFIGGESEEKIKIVKRKNTVVASKEMLKKEGLSKLFKMLKPYFKESDKVFLHGLFTPQVVFFLMLNPKFAAKCRWIVWGADLYAYCKPKKLLRQKIYEYMRAACIKRFNGLLTYIKGDYELARKWYAVKGNYFECIMYPSNFYKEIKIENEVKDKIYIQIGNSADPTNEHIEIINKLEKFKEEQIEIICPLSYGDKKYAENIKKIGEEKFGNKFNALMDFLSLEKYLDILSNIDIAIFNHNRQQAMGNIITLIGLGKKVYIKKGITTWEFFLKNGIKVYDNSFVELEKIDNEIKLKNIELIKKYFSEEKLYKQFEKIFFDN